MRAIKAESEESGESEASKHTEEKTALKQEVEEKEEPCEVEITHPELFDSASEQASTSGVKTEKTSAEETGEDGAGSAFIHSGDVSSNKMKHCNFCQKGFCSVEADTCKFTQKLGNTRVLNMTRLSLPRVIYRATSELTLVRNCSPVLSVARVSQKNKI